LYRGVAESPQENHHASRFVLIDIVSVGPKTGTGGVINTPPAQCLVDIEK